MFNAKRKPSITARRRLTIESLQTRMALDASLSGFVFVDSDGNGTRDAGEIGVPGAVVTLAGTDSSGGAVHRSTLSQSNGAYSFTSIAAGNYRVFQRQPSAFSDGRDSTLVTSAVTDNDLFSNIVIADGQQLVNNNFGEQHLRPEFISIKWLFKSAPPLPQLLRESVARAEAMAGDVALADAIRADGNATSNTNARPVAIAESFRVNGNQALNISVAAGVLKNDIDPDGDALTAQVVSSPANGTLTLHSNGSFVYAPNTSFHGTDSFTYRAHDGALSSDPATVTIQVMDPQSVPQQAVPDFTLTDVNSHSASHNQPVSPRDYLEQVSGWYFGHST